VVVEGACDAALEAVHGSTEGVFVAGLADQMEVIALDGVLDEAEAGLVASNGEVVHEQLDSRRIAEAREAVGDAAGDVHHSGTGEARPGRMRDTCTVSALLSTCALAGSTMETRHREG